MAEEKIVIRDPTTKEDVAFKLLDRIMYYEDRSNWTRKEILDVFAECLQASSGYRRTEK